MSENTNKNCTCHAVDNEGCRYILGINCDVKSCVHHDKDCHCTAENIVVGPSYAATSNDTICATFKPRKG